MKNPFERNDHSVLIGGVIAGSVIAGAAAYLFLTEAGSSVRRQLAERVDGLKLSIFGNGVEPVVEADPEYLKKPRKSPKTDRGALKKNEILHEENPDNTSEGTQQS